MLYLFRLAVILLCFAGSVAAQSVNYERRFMHDGQARLYYLNAPKNLPKNAPLVVALHGMGGQAHRMRYGLGLHDLSMEMEFATLFPQGGMFGEKTTYWNVGLGLGPHDDVGFLSRLIAHVTETHGLDASRVYVLGISNGGQMAYHLACHRSDQIAGIAVVIGTMSSHDWATCDLRAPVSLLHIHGDEDPVYSFMGGKAWYGEGEYPAVPELVARWAKQTAAAPVNAPAAPVSHSQITRYETPQGLPVELLTIEGFGHDWPHQKNAGFSASRFIAEFFMEQARQP